MPKYNQGDRAYIIESNRFIREVKIIKYSGGFYLIKFLDTGGGIKVKESRLYSTEEEAKEGLKR